MISEQTFTTIEPVLATAYGGVVGAIYGAIAGIATRRYLPFLAPPSLAQCARMGARDFSPFTAALFGFDSIMRGRDDLKSRMHIGSGVGMAYSVMRHGLKVQSGYALSYAAAFAVMSGVMYKVDENITARSERSSIGNAFDA